MQLNIIKLKGNDFKTLALVTNIYVIDEDNYINF